jgi:hypothetical protein
MEAGAQPVRRNRGTTCCPRDEASGCHLIYACLSAPSMLGHFRLNTHKVETCDGCHGTPEEKMQ